MRLATLAVNLGFLFASFALGVSAGRHERDRSGAGSERQPVAGSSPNAPAAEPAPVAESKEQAQQPAAVAPAEPKSWGRVAAEAQAWTAAVRADQNYGAGVVITRSGLVLTNLHVVEGTRSVTVTPFGVQPTPADVIDTDDDLDVALLRLARAAEGTGSPRSPLQVAALGSVKSLAVGDEVLAVGSPRKMYFSVSRGMVSFPNRFLDGVEYIQTDLPINVGNSGGPLVDREGRVVGIVSFILKDSQGISFALPIDRALARFAKALESDATASSAAASAAPAAPPAEAGSQKDNGPPPKERQRTAPAQRAKRKQSS